MDTTTTLRASLLAIVAEHGLPAVQEAVAAAEGAPRVDWESPPLSFSTAAAVWASAAGIAGAYVPQEFAALAAVVDDGHEVIPHEMTAELLAEAARRAAWRAKWGGCSSAELPFGRPPGTYMPPRTAVVEYGRLVWRTSVDTVLCPAEDQRYWLVRIEGQHITRREAAERTLTFRLGSAS